VYGFETKSLVKKERKKTLKLFMQKESKFHLKKVRPILYRKGIDNIRPKHLITYRNHNIYVRDFFYRDGEKFSEISNKNLKILSKPPNSLLSIRCKNLHRFLLNYRAYIRGLQVHSLGDERNYFYNAKDIKNIISTLPTSKNLRNLSFSKAIDKKILKTITKLRRLEKVSLYLLQEQVFDCKKLFQGLNSLKTLQLNLKLYEYQHSSRRIGEDKVVLFYQFFENLGKLPKLKTLTLDLTKISFPSSLPVLETIIHYLEKLQLSNFRIYANLEQRKEFDMEKTRSFFSQIDYFALLESSGLDISILNEDIFRKNKKSLVLMIEKNALISFWKIIEQCQNLKTLCFKVFIEDNLIQSLLDAKFPSSVRNLLLSFPTEIALDEKLEAMKAVLRNIENFDNLSFENLFGVYSNLSCIIDFFSFEAFKFIKSLSFSSRCFGFIFKYKETPENIVEDFWEQISKFKDLKSLKIDTTCFELFLGQSVKKAFVSLKNLECLEISLALSFGIRNAERDIFIPLSSAPELTYFKISTHLFSECSIMFLFDEILQLRKLQFIDIYGQMTNSYEIKLKIEKIVQKIFNRSNIQRIRQLMQVFKKPQCPDFEIESYFNL